MSKIEEAIAIAEDRMTVSRLGLITARMVDKDILAFRKIKTLLESMSRKPQVHVLSGSGIGPTLAQLNQWVMEHTPIGMDPKDIPVGIYQQGNQWSITLRIEDLS